MTVLKCISVRYENGDFYLSQGHKNNYRSNYYHDKDGYFVQETGYGWARNVKGSKLILIVEENNEQYEIWVDAYFKKHLRKLTADRREAIIKTMPSYVEVTYHETKDGQMYFKVSEDSLAAWYEDALYYL